MKKIRQIGYRLLTRNKVMRSVLRKGVNSIFPGSGTYWERRYRKNGNSGMGSYGEKASYKASILNRFVGENNIQTVLEFGCGDGNQLKMFDFPSYTGLDVSHTAIEKCRIIFKNDTTKAFNVYGEGFGNEELKAELVLSLDVIYHLIENEVYEKYMRRLFSSALKYVIIYAWDVEEGKKYHVRHRKFTKWIEGNITDFQLIKTIRKDSYCDFFIYRREEA